MCYLHVNQQNNIFFSSLKVWHTIRFNSKINLISYSFRDKLGAVNLFFIAFKIIDMSGNLSNVVIFQ